MTRRAPLHPVVAVFGPATQPPRRPGPLTNRVERVVQHAQKLENAAAFAGHSNSLKQPARLRPHSRERRLTLQALTPSSQA